MNWIKRLYTRIFPASKYQLKAQTEMLQNTLKQMEKNNEKLLVKCTRDIKSSTKSEFQNVSNSLTQVKATIAQQNDSLAQIKATIAQQNDLIAQLHHQIDELRNENNIQSKEMQKIVSDYNANYTKSFKDIIQLQKDTIGFAHENNWGIIFNNTISGSDWLKQTNFSLGRWAIGYQCAYVLYRILDEAKPQKILELGLGQSTKFISQYASANHDVEHLIVENNFDWITFFKSNYEISANSEIIQCDWGFTDFESAENVRIFEGLEEKIADKKFNLIMIDAPLGSDMKEFSRIDVLKKLPECLDSSFIILIDDVERTGEKNTFNAMKDKLAVSEIKYNTGIYHGKKSVGVIVSEDLKFITTM